ncbi:DUF952 domain-containing protein [Paenibacillus sp. KN14-4R]|uniref:DUF952 domain-containing protein n=1 Tax=Paenibacillus sp. KN14-4R TaxID=3445773 RepID=UPI003F9EF0EC
MIFHIISRIDWNLLKDKDIYEPASIAEEGFIHCSTQNQVIGVAESFYKGKDDLLLLAIAEDRVHAKVVFEDLYDLGQKYPHIYGALNLDAVEHIYHLKMNPNGAFELDLSEGNKIS